MTDGDIEDTLVKSIAALIEVMEPDRDVEMRVLTRVLLRRNFTILNGEVECA